MDNPKVRIIIPVPYMVVINDALSPATNRFGEMDPMASMELKAEKSPISCPSIPSTIERIPIDLIRERSLRNRLASPF